MMLYVVQVILCHNKYTHARKHVMNIIVLGYIMYMLIQFMYVHYVVRGNDGIYIISGDGMKKENIRYGY